MNCLAANLLLVHPWATAGSSQKKVPMVMEQFDIRGMPAIDGLITACSSLQSKLQCYWQSLLVCFNEIPLRLQSCCQLFQLCTCITIRERCYRSVTQGLSPDVCNLKAKLAAQCCRILYVCLLCIRWSTPRNLKRTLRAPCIMSSCNSICRMRASL